MSHIIFGFDDCPFQPIRRKRAISKELLKYEKYIEETNKILWGTGTERNLSASSSLVSLDEEMDFDNMDPFGELSSSDEDEELLLQELSDTGGKASTNQSEEVDVKSCKRIESLPVAPPKIVPIVPPAPVPAFNTKLVKADVNPTKCKATESKSLENQTEKTVPSKIMDQRFLDAIAKAKESKQKQAAEKQKKKKMEAERKAEAMRRREEAMARAKSKKTEETKPVCETEGISQDNRKRKLSGDFGKLKTKQPRVERTTVVPNLKKLVPIGGTSATRNGSSKLPKNNRSVSVSPQNSSPLSADSGIGSSSLFSPSSFGASPNQSETKPIKPLILKIKLGTNPSCELVTTPKSADIKSNRCFDCDGRVKNDGLKCPKCDMIFDRKCAGLHEAIPVTSSNWMCTRCAKKLIGK
uniref:PHD-type domain-containing protein n=1 Tax=Panagrolaimus sp. JU765 TaxID=591449 RepID=A0AC34QYL6_9BILA